MALARPRHASVLDGHAHLLGELAVPVLPTAPPNSPEVYMSESKRANDKHGRRKRQGSEMGGPELVEHERGRHTRNNTHHTTMAYYYYLLLFFSTTTTKTT